MLLWYNLCSMKLILSRPRAHGTVGRAHR